MLFSPITNTICKRSIGILKSTYSLTLFLSEHFAVVVDVQTKTLVTKGIIIMRSAEVPHLVPVLGSCFIPTCWTAQRCLPGEDDEDVCIGVHSENDKCENLYMNCNK